MNQVAEQLRTLDLSEYPDVHGYEEELDALLWLLTVTHKEAQIDTLTAAEVSELLRDVYLVDVSRQKAVALLSQAKGLVAKKRSKKETRFSIMKKGMDRIFAGGSMVQLVDPERPFSAIQDVARILECLTGTAHICDPYVDSKTLIQLQSIPSTTAIRLLTVNVNDPSKFRRDLQAYQKQYRNIEIRTDPDRSLHDRYIIDDTRMWYFGQSLNGIGKKQSFVIVMGKDIRKITLQTYGQYWNRSPIWS